MPEVTTYVVKYHMPGLDELMDPDTSGLPLLSIHLRDLGETPKPDTQLLVLSAIEVRQLIEFQTPSVAGIWRWDNNPNARVCVLSVRKNEMWVCTIYLRHEHSSAQATIPETDLRELIVQMFDFIALEAA